MNKKEEGVLGFADGSGEGFAAVMRQAFYRDDKTLLHDTQDQAHSLRCVNEDLRESQTSYMAAFSAIGKQLAITKDQVNEAALAAARANRRADEAENELDDAREKLQQASRQNEELTRQLIETRSTLDVMQARLKAKRKR